MNANLSDYDWGFEFDTQLTETLPDVPFQNDIINHANGDLQNLFQDRCHKDEDLEDFDWSELIELDYAENTQELSIGHNSTAIQEAGAKTEPRIGNNIVNIHDWLDGAFAPPEPCTYCRQRRLHCLIIRTSVANPNPITACSSCVALFRECSLARGEKRQPSEFETLAPVYGHMHGLTEEQPPTGRPPGQQEFEEKNTTSRPSFSRKGGRVLRNWFHQHQEYPYPTEEQKAALAQESGLSKRQISNWFSNARRRHRQHAKQNHTHHIYRSGSPMPRTDGFAWMTPMERWKSSPPEEEPVSKSTIRNAIVSTQYNGEFGQGSPNNLRNGLGNHHFEDLTDDTASSHLSSSISSLGTGRSESSESVSSAWSYYSGEVNWPFPVRTASSTVSRSGAATDRRRHRRRRDQATVEDHLYQCTFCRYSSKKRHDWIRHEKSVHLSLQSWLCTPDLDAVRRAIELPLTSNESQDSQTCVLCGKDSSPTHYEDSHDFGICADRPVSERTFGRKDHFWQHLQKFHYCSGRNIPQRVMQNLDELCRTERHDVPSRCGFCECRLQTWDQRADHLAAHFKQGFRMSQWRGDWGLEESILKDLREAVLPWER